MVEVGLRSYNYTVEDVQVVLEDSDPSDAVDESSELVENWLERNA
jgi:hypothetical protein